MAAPYVLTPLYQAGPDVYLKCEFLHPGRSHKARVARALIEDGEQRRMISPGVGSVLLERTGGNLGVALALEARAMGYKLTLVADPHYAAAKRGLAAKLGATVIDRGLHFPDLSTNQQVIDVLLSQRSLPYFYLNQFANPANPLAHQHQTGAEIVHQLGEYGYGPDKPVIVVAGLGTGASMRGIVTALRGHFRRVFAVGVQPPNCDLRRGVYGDHSVQGIAVGEPAPFFPASQLDAVVGVTDAEIADSSAALVQQHRFLVGPSSAANIAALARARSHPDLADINDPVFVTLLYDRGEDYL